MCYRALAPRGEYFWLGPKKGVQESLRIPVSSRRQGPYEDALRLGEMGGSPTTIRLHALVDDTAAVYVNRV